MFFGLRPANTAASHSLPLRRAKRVSLDAVPDALISKLHALTCVNICIQYTSRKLKLLELFSRVTNCQESGIKTNLDNAKICVLHFITNTSRKSRF